MGDKKIKNVLIFVAGAVIGSVVTARLVKEKYEKIAEDEIADMRDYYNEKIKKKISDKSEEKSSTEATDEEKEEYDKIITDYNKAFVSSEETKQVVESVEEDEEDEEDDEEESIYIINPQEFGMPDDYETAFLNYYTDGYVTDEFDDVIEDPERLIGKEALGNIGKFTEGLIHVRNESEMTDFEISEVSHDYMS